MPARVLLVRTFSHIGDRWVNTVRSYIVPPGWDYTFPSIVALRFAMGVHWNGIMVPWLPASATFAGWEWDDVDTDGTLLLRTGEVFGDGPGIQAGDVLPSFLAALVLLRTGLDAPVRSRALQYLPFVVTRFVGADGRLNATGLAALQALADEIAQPVTDGAGRVWVPCSYRRSTREAYPIVSGQARPQLAQQRRRGSHWPSDPAPSWL